MIYLLIGLLIGVLYRTGWDVVKDTQKKLEERKPEIGGTPGVYGKTNEFNVNQSGPVGLVRPKTPQQLEWEESVRLNEMQYKVK